MTDEFRQGKETALREFVVDGSIKDPAALIDASRESPNFFPGKSAVWREGYLMGALEILMRK